MRMLVCYDVNVSGSGGGRRLRRVAKACRDFGQRVQFSVFELDVDPAQWVLLRQLRIPAQRDRAIRSNVTGQSGGS